MGLQSSIAAAVLLSTAASAAGPVFEDASRSWGAEFRHHDSGAGYAMGGGVAWFDLDADGDDDLFLTRSDGAHRLLRNDGARFTDVTAGSGLRSGAGKVTMGVIAADYNQDGLPDLYLTNLGPNELFENLGGGAFRERGTELGVADAAWSTSAAWFDPDRDGDLDLYVGNYVDSIRFPYHICAPNRLFLNAGSPGAPRFEDAARALGVHDASVAPAAPGAAAPPEVAGCTLSVGTLDFDDDGDPDILVGNDFGGFVRPNALFRNESVPPGALRFTDVSAETRFDQKPHYNMGIAGADYDGDGDWDLYLTNLGDNLLLRNDAGRFVDVAATAGPLEGVNAAGAMLSSWGVAWTDLDNDGWEDLVVVNGDISIPGPEPRAPDRVWLNRGDGTFRRLAVGESGVDGPGPGRGLGVADADADGRIDLYVAENGAYPVALPDDRSRFYRNTNPAAEQGNWLQLRLVGWRSNLEGIGARIDVEVAGRLHRRQMLADPVYLSSSARVAHFGLGAATRIDRLTIRWPSGIRQELPGAPLGRRFDLAEPRVTVSDLTVTAGRSQFDAYGRVRNLEASERRFTAVWFVRSIEPGASRGRTRAATGEELPLWLGAMLDADPRVTAVRAHSGTLRPGEERPLDARLPSGRDAAVEVGLIVVAAGTADGRVGRPTPPSGQ